MSDLRIGLGYDIHRLVEGRPLVLGGVEIPHHRGLDGHSDADVLSHAMMDAMLGALALGDIGHHFPNTDEKFRGADSLALMAEVVRLVGENGYGVVNIDAMLMAEAPKIAPHIAMMREKLAAVIRIPVGRISIKATTNECLGAIGREEGMAAQAVVLLQKK